MKKKEIIIEQIDVESYLTGLEFRTSNSKEISKL